MFVLGFLGEAFLLRIVVENGGHVLTRVAGSGIVVFPKQLEEIPVSCLLWIKVNLNCFGVVTSAKSQGNIPVVRDITVNPRSTYKATKD